MPTYEFRCLQCKKRFERFLSYSDYDAARVNCPHCGSASVTHLIGRVRTTHNATQHLADLADPANLDQIEDDPRALGRAMKEKDKTVNQYISELLEKSKS